MEGPRLVLALPAVGTGGAATLVDVLLAPGACEPCGQMAGHLCFLHALGSLLQVFG